MALPHRCDNCGAESNKLHLIPGGEKGHVTNREDDECDCGPSAALSKDSEGADQWLIIHKPYDKSLTEDWNRAIAAEMAK